MNKLLARTRGDKMIWAVVVLLSLISAVAVYSAVDSLARRHRLDASHFLFKHVSVLAAGLIIMYLVHKVNYARLAKWTVILYLVSLPLLVYTLVAGTEIRGGSRWLSIPFFGSFQTSELAKLALFLFLARTLSLKQAVIHDFKEGFLPVLVPVFLTCILIAFANLSTALMLGGASCIIFYIGRVRVRHLLVMLLAGIVFVVLVFAISKLTHFGRAATWQHRIESFMSPKDGDNPEEGYQVLQSKIAIANGGFFGMGPGRSLQRNELPHAYSDFIYAIIIEEDGLWVGIAVVMLYLVFLWRSIVIFRRCPMAFGAFLAVGLSVTLVFQAMLNMAVTVNLLPVTGLTLPLVSMGGSSIWFTSIAIGIILSVSKYVDEMEGKGGITDEKIEALSQQERAAEEERMNELAAEQGSKLIIQTGNTVRGAKPANG